MKYIVALSGGKDSTAMALRLREMEPRRDFQFVCTPTGNELPEMVSHWTRLQELLATKITMLPTETLGSLIKRWNALPNWRQRWCTRVLKIEPFASYVALNLPANVYVGLRADEVDREGAKHTGEVAHLFPLQEWGWGLEEVIEYLEHRGIVIPDRTDCAACFFQTLGEWHSLYINHPRYYAQAMAWEEQTGHTFRSPGRDTHPASLDELAGEFELGYRPKQSRMSDREAMCAVCAR